MDLLSFQKFSPLWWGGNGRAKLYSLHQDSRRANWLFPLSPVISPGPLACQMESPTCRESFLTRLMLPGNILRHARCVVYYSLRKLSVQ